MPARLSLGKLRNAVADHRSATGLVEKELLKLEPLRRILGRRVLGPLDGNIPQDGGPEVAAMRLRKSALGAMAKPLAEPFGRLDQLIGHTSQDNLPRLDLRRFSRFHESGFAHVGGRLEVAFGEGAVGRRELPSSIDLTVHPRRTTLFFAREPGSPLLVTSHTQLPLGFWLTPAPDQAPSVKGKHANLYVGSTLLMVRELKTGALLSWIEPQVSILLERLKQLRAVLENPNAPLPEIDVDAALPFLTGGLATQSLAWRDGLEFLGGLAEDAFDLDNASAVIVETYQAPSEVFGIPVVGKTYRDLTADDFTVVRNFEGENSAFYDESCNPSFVELRFLDLLKLAGLQAGSGFDPNQIEPKFESPVAAREGGDSLPLQDDEVMVTGITEDGFVTFLRCTANYGCEYGGGGYASHLNGYLGKIAVSPEWLAELRRYYESEIAKKKDSSKP